MCKDAIWLLRRMWSHSKMAFPFTILFYGEWGVSWKKYILSNTYFVIVLFLLCILPYPLAGKHFIFGFGEWFAEQPAAGWGFTGIALVIIVLTHANLYHCRLTNILHSRDSG